jgi:hypothetical protein
MSTKENPENNIGAEMRIVEGGCYHFNAGPRYTPTRKHFIIAMVVIVLGSVVLGFIFWVK